MKREHLKVGFTQVQPRTDGSVALIEDWVFCYPAWWQRRWGDVFAHEFSATPIWCGESGIKFPRSS